MELMRYVNHASYPDEPWMGTAEILNGYTGVTWVEKYREPGEFEIVAPLDSGLLAELPLGTLVTHTETFELHMVETHVIKHEDGVPTIRISGRSLDAWLEYRVVGEFQEPPTQPNIDNGPPKVVLPPDDTWKQAAKLVREHGLTEVPNLKVEHRADEEMNLRVPSPPKVERLLKPTTVHKALMEILEIEDLGISVYRKHGSRGKDSLACYLIHGGRDLSKDVIFSWEKGALVSADYLVTMKQNFNSSVVTGEYAAVHISGSQQGYNRRTVSVDGTEADRDYAEGGNWTENRNQLLELGQRAVKTHRTFGMFNLRSSANQALRFKVDYDVGDIVQVEGLFGVKSPMRISEHTLTLDENGILSIPSFSFVVHED